MLIDPDQYVDVYKSIKEELYASQEKKVLVFAATDSCDSVCATKTLQVALALCTLHRPQRSYLHKHKTLVAHVLQTVLLRDSIPFALYPVSRYSEVQQLCKDIFAGSEQVSTISLPRPYLLISVYPCFDCSVQCRAISPCSSTSVCIRRSCKH